MKRGSKEGEEFLEINNSTNINQSFRGAWFIRQ